jgi:hypothetical protein
MMTKIFRGFDAGFIVLIVSQRPMKKSPFHFVPITKARSTQKPRANGRTMIVDDGLPLA